jgi:hypothetical protein
MAGIPKRRPGERSQSYRLRCLAAERTRRNEKQIAFFEKLIGDIRKVHGETERLLYEELVRYYRAKPGTKYDRTAKKGGKR